MDGLAALGGDRFVAVRDRVEEGRSYSFFNAKLSGLSRSKIYTRYLTAPDPPVVGFLGQRQRQVFGKDETAYVLLDEERGYNVTYRGARPVPAVDYERYREGLLHNVLYIYRMRLNEPGMLFEWKGLEIYNNIPVDVVDFIDADNRVTTVYFDQTTHLPMRQSWFRRNPISHERDEEITLLSKYRATAGAWWPWVVTRERNGERIFEMYAEGVEINTGVGDEKFTLSGNVPILKDEAVMPAKIVMPGKKK